MTKPEPHPSDTDPTRISLRLFGPIALTLGDGTDLTPKPHKARALLAMLATAPEQRRARRWLEERLWSDRHPQQAAGSLRQSLVDLRKALGAQDDVLTADREWVALSGVRVEPPEAPPGEFLEGLRMRDPAFLRWADAMRRNLLPGLSLPMTRTGEQTEPIVIACGTANLPGTGSGIVAEIIAARIANDIAEHITASTVTGPRETAGPPPDIEITCNVIEDNGVCLAFVKVVHLPSSRVLFSQDCRFVGTATSLAGSEVLIQAAFEAAERTVAKVPHVLGLGRVAIKSAALGQLALHKMFSFDEAQLSQADRLMEQAYEVEGNAVHLAWRGLLQMVKAIELGQAQRPELHDLAHQLTHHALEQRDSNSTVQALVSQTRAMLFGDAVAAGQAAARALEANPRNPFALQAMAVARMLADDGEEAYRLSALGRSFAGRSTFRHWWDAHHTTICVATGRMDEAIRAAEAAAFGAPGLRPAYRYLLSLYAQRGDMIRAIAMKEKLEALEPGFTLDRMLGDPDYPVRTLRKTGLLKEIKKLL